MGRWGLVFVICIFATHAACAEDAGLQALSAKLIAIRGTHGINTMRDAGPELTPIKHDLREWIERQLHGFGQHGNAEAFAKRLNEALQGMACGARCAQDPAEEDDRGFVGDVALAYVDYDRYLAVQTNVGVRCGFDTSAYVYEWRNAGWRRLLQSEQDNYDEKVYAPQNFFFIQVASDIDAEKTKRQPLVLTVGYSPWCESNWQMIYTRLWRASSISKEPAALVDEANELFLDDDEADARLAPDEAIVEFKGSSIDRGILVRTHVLHYLIHGDQVERIQPVALNPRDFVDEWLTRPWSESASWTDAMGDGSSLKKFYLAQHGKDGRPLLGEFDGPPKHCRGDPTLWQVAFYGDGNDPGPYVLVRWMAPYRFTMMKIRKDKFPGCDVKDAMPDNLGTLFPFPPSSQ